MFVYKFRLCYRTRIKWFLMIFLALSKFEWSFQHWKLIFLLRKLFLLYLFIEVFMALHLMFSYFDRELLMLVFWGNCCILNICKTSISLQFLSTLFSLYPVLGSLFRGNRHTTFRKAIKTDCFLICFKNT